MNLSPRAPKSTAISKTIYIGKSTKFVDKRIFEILAQLKDFGVDRIIQRNLYKQLYPNEPSYFKITQVAPQMDPELKYGRCWGIEVFRGKKYPDILEICTAYEDYSLVRVHEEPDFENFFGESTHQVTILPTIPSSPVMAEVINRTRLDMKPLYMPVSDQQEHIPSRITNTLHH